MSRVEQLEEQVAALNPDELRIFREWFVQFEEDDWDRQIAADSESGKLDWLVQRAIRDDEAGLATDL